MKPTLSDLILLLVAIGGFVFVGAAAVLNAIARRDASKTAGREATDVEAEDEDSSQPDRLTRRLRGAGLNVSPVAFIGVLLVAAFAASMFVLEMFGGMLLPALLAFALIAYLLFNLVVELARFRALKFEERLVEAVDLLVGALRSGESPTQALTTTASACEPPVKGEFEEVVRRLGVGMPIASAANRMLDRYDSEGVRLFTSTLAAKWTAGGDLAPVLRSVNAIMRDRIRNRLRLQSQLSGARLASFLVALSPYVLLLAFHWRNPGWIERLMSHPAGPALLFVAVCMQIVGFLWLHRMMRVDL